jgi:hypothetical protein
MHSTALLPLILESMSGSEEENNSQTTKGRRKQ